MLLLPCADIILLERRKRMLTMKGYYRDMKSSSWYRENDYVRSCKLNLRLFPQYKRQIGTFVLTFLISQRYS
jgi:hypothetical protein